MSLLVSDTGVLFGQNIVVGLAAVSGTGWITSQARGSASYGPLSATGGPRCAEPGAPAPDSCMRWLGRQPPTTRPLPRLLRLRVGRRTQVAGGAARQSPREKPREIRRLALPLRA